MEKELILAGVKPRRFWLKLEGADLEQTTWSAAGKPKATTKSFADTQAASDAYGKTLRKKLREGYAFIGSGSQPGDIIHESFAAGGGGGAVLDLSLDGRLAATASITSDSMFGAKVHVIDVATGARRVVVDEPGGVNQCFLHATLFDRTGQGLYFVLRDETWHLDLASGVRKVIANGSGHFNPFVVHPNFDRYRRRLVVFAEGGLVRVLDEAGASLLDVPTLSPTTECRGASISASGSLLAVYVVSRGIIYDHADARHDTTNEVQIWDIEARTKRASVPFVEKLHKVGLTPDDDALVVTFDYARGPVCVDIASGEERWRFADELQADKLATAFCWAFSPDGSRLAVGRGVLRLYETATRREITLQDASDYRAECVIFSGDGTRLAASVSRTCIVHCL